MFFSNYTHKKWFDEVQTIKSNYNMALLIKFNVISGVMYMNTDKAPTLKIEVKTLVTLKDKQNGN